MRTELKNNDLTLYLEGRIDSNHAAETEAAMLEAIRKHPGADIVLDAENLEYISSAGLRALMTLRKYSEDPITIKSVSAEVYEIFEMTGFTELFDVQKALRSVSTDGLEIIGKGTTATVYRLDREMVLKVFDSTHSWVLPVENNEGEFVGFIRKSTVLAAYRQVLADFSSD